MEQENLLILSEKLLALLDKRRSSRKKKGEFVKKKNYEKAAKERDVERKNEEKILVLLQDEFKYDFTKSIQVESDIMQLLDLVEDGDVDFTNAIKKLSVVDLERLKLMKDVEEYNLNTITLDELHNRIKMSFNSVREDVVKNGFKEIKVKLSNRKNV